MTRSDPDLDDELQDHYRDLEMLRRMAKERGSIDRQSTEWLEHEKSEEALARKIRDWARRSEGTS